jgi:hypothetical protein
MNRQWLAALPLVLGVVSIVRAETILYQEDFEDGVADGMTTYGSWDIDWGLNESSYGYHASGSHSALMLDNIPSDDVAVDVDFRVFAASWGDFDVWLNTDLNFPWPTRGYDAMVNPVGSDNPFAILSDMGEGTWLDSTLNTIQANETHHLRVEKLGSSILVLQDGQEILSATDSTWSGGRIGFRIAGGGVIDNIVVTTPEPTTLAMLALGLLAVLRRMRLRHAVPLSVLNPDP